VTKRSRIIIIALIAVIIVAGVGVAVSMRSIEPRLQEWLKASLSESLDGDVELGTVRLTWVPLRLHASNLTVRHHGRTDIPPLVIVQTFTMDLRPTDLWSSTIDRAWVDGLEINIPPKDPDTGKRPLPFRGDGSGDGGGDADTGQGLFIRRLTATNTRLAVIPQESGKNARVWDIYELDVRNIGNGEPASFTAALLNPLPYGTIDASGHFGPWQSDAPGSSALSGQYTFAADLGTIDGLAGQLTAIGDMRGTLEEIATTGETHTPDFKLTELDGISLPLSTTYDAMVDGTKGDVELKSVNITMGKSTLTAAGRVEGTKGVKGKRIIVNVKSTATDLSELLQLTSKAARPVADGVLTIDAAMDLPQGKQPVLERLSLAGSVRADQLTFTNEALQGKIDELSRRGRGKPGDDTINNVASKMATTFTLEKGAAVYRNFSFSVRGATIRLDGTHSLKTKAVNLSGAVLLSASMSDTQTGLKSWVLKPFDGLFRKGGAGSRLAVTVQGTQDQPKLEFDFKRTLKGS
jgi:AsmA-like C-terminal region